MVDRVNRLSGRVWGRVKDLTRTAEFPGMSAERAVREVFRDWELVGARSEYLHQTFVLRAGRTPTAAAGHEDYLVFPVSRWLYAEGIRVPWSHGTLSARAEDLMAALDAMTVAPLEQAVLCLATRDGADKTTWGQLSALLELAPENAAAHLDSHLAAHHPRAARGVAGFRADPVYREPSIQAQRRG